MLMYLGIFPRNFQYFRIKQVISSIYKEAIFRIFKFLNSCLKDVLEFTPASSLNTLFCILTFLLSYNLLRALTRGHNDPVCWDVENCDTKTPNIFLTSFYMDFIHPFIHFICLPSIITDIDTVNISYKICKHSISHYLQHKQRIHNIDLQFII